ncbi:hypothetical protein N7489_005705 [Penicillium chrysogenum]|uniref:Uncharacterized protein n=1 Tax=Penicillium chrysogenum TaxID=5076 RepID=A0ABQ8WNJ6_PENCH|nr:uncharacterized protein N7489_005705 [Penicillium chrysogenum]KAJ5245609.1 hypothetical protein N7489_005705 [Penicillium chrysogenum]KAJ5274299.1 hypothetical protein N7505_002844 [Penicillium chrysogenum]KAJ6156010.1 hypothetical protein N7497_004895 [Penicillium chrysogenum]
MVSRDLSSVSPPSPTTCFTPYFTPLKEVASNRNISTIGEWELDLLTRLRVQREQREHAREQILEWEMDFLTHIFAEANEIINMVQGIMATAHPQNVQAQNMLFALQQRLLSLRRDSLN